MGLPCHLLRLPLTGSGGTAGVLDGPAPHGLAHHGCALRAGLRPWIIRESEAWAEGFFRDDGPDPAGRSVDGSLH